MQKLKRAASLLCRGILVFHLGTQLCYTAQTVYSEQYPSPRRAAFRQEFGFSLRGYEEVDNRDLGDIAAVLHKEHLEKPFTLTSLRIRSPSYLRQSLDQQLDGLISVGNAGYYFMGHVVLDASAGAGTVHHEVKHAKAEAVMDAHPEFRQQWLDLAKDNQGNSFYLSAWDAFCSRYKGLHLLIKEPDPVVSERLGFVTNYARTNVDEDIAELCEEAECRPRHFISLRHNERIAAKIKLAETYGLLPKEFSAYVALLDARSEDFLEHSAQFLVQCPKSVYELDVHRQRGDLLEALSLEAAALEYESGLQARYKDPWQYRLLLCDLQRIHKKLGNTGKERLYAVASVRYEQQKETNFHLALSGSL
ncbi:hypothetical protein HY639_00470 [Candidatus Woesearchaeota archaeon]|nr:hypothetical protein [Candidatus Woesearchaeota archaeon]